MNDFMFRRRITPIPNFVKAAVNEIRNSIFQRMRDIVRKGGSAAYQDAVSGLDGGVDHRGCTMNSFLGLKVLTELLVMGKTGVFVDNQANVGPTLTDSVGITPYLYCYPLEDILSYTCNKPSQPSEFQAVLLRDIVQQYDFPSGLPINEVVRYRRLWIDKGSGKVRLQFYTSNGVTIDPDGNPSDKPIELNLTRIPFVLLDIGDSLVKDVCDHQIALLNLGSSDVSYALKSNFPFIVKQEDTRAAGRTSSSTTTRRTAAAGASRPACARPGRRSQQRLDLSDAGESAGVHQSIGRPAAGVDGTPGQAKGGHSEPRQPSGADVGDSGVGRVEDIGQRGARSGAVVHRAGAGERRAAHQ